MSGTVSALRRCWQLLPPAERRRWARLVPLSLIAAALEAVGATAIYALIHVVAEPGRARQVPLIERWLGRAGLEGETEALLAIAALVGLFYLLKNVFLALFAWAENRIIQRSVTELSSRLLRSYLQAPYLDHLRIHSSQQIQRTTAGADRVVRFALGGAFALASESLVALAIVAVLVAAAPLATLGAATLLVALLTVLLALTQRRFRRWSANAQRLEQEAIQGLQEGLGGFREVRLLGLEDHFLQRFGGTQRRLERTRVRQATLAAAPRFVIETVFVLGTVLILFVLTRAAEGPTEALALLGLYAYGGFRLIPTANRVVLQLNLLAAGSAVVDELQRDLELGREPAAAPPVERLPLRSELRLEAVSFRYPGGGPPALADVDLVVRRGEALGIAGETGAGKTTLLALLLGLLCPSAGRITVDGTDLDRHLGEWRAGLGYVPQDVFLVDDSLRRNIALGDPRPDAERLRRATAAAQLDPFVARLPQGLETTVGEGGVRLSAGERQRLAIARALYREPELLLLDEATANLDLETEHRLLAAVANLRGQVTLVVVSHRPAPLQLCDRVVLLERGRVRAVGPPGELLPAG